MVESASGNSSIAAGCGILSCSCAALSRVRGIGACSWLSRIGAFAGVVAFGTALKTNNIGPAVDRHRVASWAVVVVVGAVGIIGARCWRWCRGSVSWLGCRCKAASLQAARSFLVAHTPLAALKHGFTLGLQLDGFVHKRFHVLEVMDDKCTLHLVMKPVQEALNFLLLGVDVIRSVPCKIGKLVQITDDILATLAQSTELIFLPLYKPAGNVLLAELVLKLCPGDDVVCLLDSLGGFPPSTCRSSKVVSGIEDFLVVSYSSNLEIVLDGAKPIICFKWVLASGKGGWVGFLEITQSGSLVSLLVLVLVLVVVVGSSYLLQGC